MKNANFTVFKFLRNDEDETVYDVGLESWVTDLKENMTGKIKWPPKSTDAGSLVRRQKPADPNWSEEPVLVKKFYGKPDKM